MMDYMNDLVKDMKCPLHGEPLVYETYSRDSWEGGSLEKYRVSGRGTCGCRVTISTHDPLILKYHPNVGDVVMWRVDNNIAKDCRIGVVTGITNAAHISVKDQDGHIMCIPCSWLKKFDPTQF